MPCEEYEGNDVACCKPYVALFCWGERTEVRKAKFGLGSVVSEMKATHCKKTYWTDSTAERMGW